LLILHNIALNRPRLSGFEFPTIVMICIACIDSCKSNYYTFTTSTSPLQIRVNFTTFIWKRHYNYSYTSTHLLVIVLSYTGCRHASLGFVVTIQNFFSLIH